MRVRVGVVAGAGAVSRSSLSSGAATDMSMMASMGTSANQNGILKVIGSVGLRVSVSTGMNTDVSGSAGASDNVDVRASVSARVKGV